MKVIFNSKFSKHIFLVLFAGFFLVQFSVAQDEEISVQIIESIESTGSIQIMQDSSVLKLLNNQILLNKENHGIPNGYRIQIYSVSGNDAREKAIEFKERFLEFHTDYDREEVYDLYQPPFVRLRVGDYRNRHEALIVYKKLVEYYPNCYIVRSKINFPKLIE